MEWFNSRGLVKLAAAAIVAASVSFAAVPAEAAVTAIANPGGTSEIGARIRWGRTGFEASLFDVSPFVQNPIIDAIGAPAWAINTPYNFSINFGVTTGALSLSVLGQTISKNAFAAPGQTDYTGYTFEYLAISGNESGSAARSLLDNLVINGTNFANITPGGSFAEKFYKFSPLELNAINITGRITFLTSGTADERPSWNFNLQNAQLAAPVPEPSTWAMMLIGFAGLAFVSRRRQTVRA
jgi:hypothetical protein